MTDIKRCELSASPGIGQCQGGSRNSATLVQFTNPERRPSLCVPHATVLERFSELDVLSARVALSRLFLSPVCPRLHAGAGVAVHSIAVVTGPRVRGWESEATVGGRNAIDTTLVGPHEDGTLVVVEPKWGDGSLRA